MKFLIQKIGNDIVHDFSFELIQSKKYWDWLGKNEISIRYTNEVIPERIAYDNYIPIGSVEFVSEYLRRFYPMSERMLYPLNVPDMLIPFAGRRVKDIHTIKDLYCFHDSEYVFRKNNYKIKDDRNGLYLMKDSGLHNLIGFQVSDRIDIESEWRVFVFHDEIQHISNYSGDPLLMPDVTRIRNMVDAYKDESPVAYTLDVGINNNGNTIIIECHRFFSCGLYGFSDYSKIPYMFSQTWFQMKKNKLNK